MRENLHILVSEVSVRTAGKRFILGGLLKALSLSCPFCSLHQGSPGQLSVRCSFQGDGSWSPAESGIEPVAGHLPPTPSAGRRTPQLQPLVREHPSDSDHRPFFVHVGILHTSLYLSLVFSHCFSGFLITADLSCLFIFQRIVFMSLSFFSEFSVDFLSWSSDSRAGFSLGQYDGPSTVCT